jgi:hypothetical protein
VPAHDEETLYVDDPVAVAKVRLATAVTGVICHGLRLAFLAPILVAIFASAVLTMAITETHDRFLPPLVQSLPIDLDQYEDQSWDVIGRDLAAPVLMMWFGLSVAIGLIERATGLRLYNYLPKWWHWLLFFVVLFATFTILAITYRAAEVSAPLAAVIVGLLNLCCAAFASLSALALKLVSTAEEGTADLLYKRYGLVRIPREPRNQ